jgi:integrase
MGSVCCRGRKLWLKYKGSDGAWVSESSGLTVGQEKAVRRLLAKIEARVAAGMDAGGRLTVRAYTKQWLNEREAQHIASVRDDKSRLNNHVLPHIGHLELSEVTPRHVRDILRRMRAEAKLAPRTQRNIYAAMHRLFADALDEDLIDANPCRVRRRELPVSKDADPVWRTRAVFTRREVEQLISDTRLPEERRLIHALLFLTGMRFGELAALRWSHWDSALEPLGRLLVALSYSVHLKREKGVKTEATRKVPVHPCSHACSASGASAVGLAWSGGTPRPTTC